MKNLIFFGIAIFIIGSLIFYFDNAIFDLRVFYSGLCGIGIGLIVGGLFGYISKGNAVKEAKIKEELRQLQKEKAELEKSQNPNSTNIQL